MDEKLAAQVNTLNPEYLVFYPTPKTPEPLPLVIYLHGAGGVGDEIKKSRGRQAKLHAASYKTKKTHA